MLGRIIKFRRGEQYEEMQGRDVDSVSPAPSANSDTLTNRNPDAAHNSAVSPQDTTPEGTLFRFH